MLNGQRVGSVFGRSGEFSGRLLSENDELVIYEMPVKWMSTPPAIRLPPSPLSSTNRRIEVLRVRLPVTAGDAPDRQPDGTVGRVVGTASLRAGPW
jgi:hypothetical protein